MHLDLTLGNPSVLQAHRKLRRARNRLRTLPVISKLSPRACALIVIAALLIAACIAVIVPRSHRSRQLSSGVPAGDQAAHLLAACANAPLDALETFDPFVFSLERRGLSQPAVENRYQEDVWDTLVQTALYPAWSDMRWNIPQYSRALALDLARVQHIAATATGYDRAPVNAPPVNAPPPYRSPRSPISIKYVHHRLDRLRGLQFAIHFVPKIPRPPDANSSFTMLIQHSLESPCTVSMRTSHTADAVYVLLPYKDRQARLRRFLDGFAHIRKTGENVVLIISVLKGSADVDFVNSLKAELTKSAGADVGDAVWLHQNEGDVEGSFSRGVALRDSAKLVSDPDAVLFHCDVDMLIAPGFFERCRRNSIGGSQVYYPVFYSLYPYTKRWPVIAERNGFWRKTSFGMVCMRKRDFERVGAYDDAETRFHGWGSEDVFQFEKVRNSSHLVAVRAAEPGLLHQWHSKQCDRGSVAYVDCMKTNFVTMGHAIRVGPVLVQWLRNVDGFFKALTEL